MLTTAPTRLECNNADLDESVVMHVLAEPVTIHALPGRPVTIEVVPPPDSNGFLPTRDGTRQYVPSIGALVDRLNVQEAGLGVSGSGDAGANEAPQEC